MLVLLALTPLVLLVTASLVLAIDGEYLPLRQVTDRIAIVLLANDRASPLANRRILQAAQVSTPPRLYTARTRLYAAVFGVTGAVAGVYAAVGVGRFLRAGRSAEGRTGLAALVSEPLGVTSPVGPVGTNVKVALVLLVASGLFATLAVALTYLVRYYAPRQRASTRRRRIESSMPRTVAFTYALSRGGMTFPEVLRSLARNERVFGEGAAEFRVAVRDVDLLGRDLTTSIRKVAVRTPSDAFRGLCENLASVLQSGQDLPSFLRSQYERYRDDAAEKQDEMIEQLATAAEVYVTVAVAGMLFLITILLIIGLTSGDTLTLIQLVTYLGIPVINVVFVAYLADLTADISGQRVLHDLRNAERLGPIPTARFAPRALTDGGTALASKAERIRANHERLVAYRSFEQVRRLAARPLDALLDRPVRVFYLTVPVAMLYLSYELVPLVVAGQVPTMAALDDVLVFTFVFLLGTFGLVYEASQHRLKQLEAALPDLLDRMASLNEAGMTVVQSFDRIRTSDLGAMNPELERIWADIQWGATVSTALRRFERRVRTPSVTRLVTLVTSSMRASSDVGPVLRIAASEARAERRFKRTRRQEMSTYLIAIYVAFLVFLVVIVTMDAFFIPKLVEATSGLKTGAGASVGGFMSLSEQAVADYRLTFFHAALLQAAFSGVIGGQMSDGSLESGVKHSAVMVAVTYVVFELAQLLL
ncbi:type II secretion system F family protein [Halomarina litorea]|uniref:type II secretion system F family protein n=1 Tax=Halomarina litorea TaxID=2961595 RepID=UPI0020C35397|nr:type II secretion system F family protein [Halomarina sp. BCD28]